VQELKPLDVELMLFNQCLLVLKDADDVLFDEASVFNLCIG